jgi:hypothetical protein
MQDKIVNALRKIAADHKLETAETWNFANIGNFYFQRPDDFEPTFLVHVSFQDKYLTGNISRVGGVRAQEFPCTQYMVAGDVQKFLDAVKYEAIAVKVKAAPKSRKSA